MNPFFFMPFMQGMNFQCNPFPFPNPMADDNADSSNDSNAQNNQFQDMFSKMWQMPNMGPQGMNPFVDMFSKMWQMPNMGPQGMNPFVDMFSKMWQMPNMGSQGMNPFVDMFSKMWQMPNMDSQGMNPFVDMFSKMWQMPNIDSQEMNQSMNQFTNPNFFNPWAYHQACMAYCMQAAMELAKMLSSYIDKIKDNVNSDGTMPFGMPAEVLRTLINIDSSPEGLSKFQKILDIIFNLYSQKGCAKEGAENCSQEACTTDEVKETVQASAEENHTEDNANTEDLLNNPDIPDFVKRMIREKGSAALGNHDISYYMQKYGKKK